MKNIVLPVINLLPFIRDLKLSWHRTVVGHNTTETYVNRGSGPVPQAACAEKKKKRVSTVEHFPSVCYSREIFWPLLSTNLTNV